MIAIVASNTLINTAQMIKIEHYFGHIFRMIFNKVNDLALFQYKNLMLYYQSITIEIKIYTRVLNNHFLDILVNRIK